MEFIYYVALFSLIFTFVYVIINRRSSRRLPPGPFAWPIVGNLRLFQKDPQGYKKFSDLAEKYGNIYRWVDIKRRNNNEPRSLQRDNNDEPMSMQLHVAST